MTNGMGEWCDEHDDIPARTTESIRHETEAPGPFIPNVAAFVSDKLATTYRRQINFQGGTIWCPRWWKHAKAISRLEALWRVWEYLCLDGITRLSARWRNHADHHINTLLSADGPFKGCNPDDGHRTELARLPCEESPVGCSKFNRIRSHTSRLGEGVESKNHLGGQGPTFAGPGA